jgi:hypothetical protein
LSYWALGAVGLFEGELGVFDSCLSLKLLVTLEVTWVFLHLNSRRVSTHVIQIENDEKVFHD